LTEIEVSIVIPCLNEELTLKNCIATAFAAFERFGYSGEVIVADNRSTDASVAIAKSCGARVVDVPVRGYGSALTTGINAARGKYVVIGDADESYDFMQIDRFVEMLRRGTDFVMGTRLRGEIEPGAMPDLHRYLGTPVLTFLMNMFFGTKFSDCNCGIRGFNREAFCRMKTHTTGMEWASETMIKASLLKLKMSEVPVTLRVDKRDRRPHLRPWRDGWHHLRFILTYATDKILFLPGLLLVVLGSIGFVLLAQHAVVLLGFFMDYHFLFPSALSLLLGTQMIMLSFLTKTYTGLSAYDAGLGSFLRSFTFEWGIIAGAVIILAGLFLNGIIILEWRNSHGHGLFAVRQAVIATTWIALGAQLLFNFFFMSVLQIPQKDLFSNSQAIESVHDQSIVTSEREAQTD
jgi:glycosyltransferase involved in cell wall biosynthesis